MKEHKTHAVAERAKNGKQYYEIEAGKIDEHDTIVLDMPIRGKTKYYYVTGLGKTYKKNVTPTDVPTYVSHQRAYVKLHKVVKADGSVKFYDK